VEERLMWGLLKVVLGFMAIGLEIVGHLPLAPLFWLGRMLGRGAAVDAVMARVVRAWGRRCLMYLQCRVEVDGLGHVPRSGPVILMANHQSLLDIPVCLGFLGRTMGFVAKRELFRIPGLSLWMRELHCASIDRADVRSSGALLEAFSRKVRAGGYCLLIFPEGTRTRHPGGELGPFRRGALRLAQAEGIPVVPVSLDGTRFLAKLKALSRIPPERRVVRVRIAPLVPVPRHLSAPAAKRLMESLRETIVSNWHAVRIDWTQPVQPEPRNR
jgi:1-acyl-sn-glycerol-3-phosphate acyltransferase